MSVTISSIEQPISIGTIGIRLPGLPGADGAAATVEVGTVTTGAAGASASVTNSGTASAAKLDFVIPKGDKGDTGDTGATGATGAQGVQGEQGVKGDTGNGVVSIAKTSGTGAAGTTDTYTITYTDTTTTTFPVYNGADGEDGITPTIDAEPTEASTNAVSSGSVYSALAAKVGTSAIVNDLTTGGATVPLSAEQGKALKAQVDAKVSTTSIINNDTSGGAAVPASAEIVKTHGAEIDANSASISALATKVTEKTSYGVYTGLAVSAQSTPDMTVSVATGTIYMSNGDRFTPTANTALAITAADTTNPRIDIVYVDRLGVISYRAGTAAASPSAPSVPTGGQKLAEISVAANATTIVTANIADRQKGMWNEAYITPTMLNGATLPTDADMPLRYWKDQFGWVHLQGRVNNLTVGASYPFMTLPSGYRADKTRFSVAQTSTGYGEIVISSTGTIYLRSGGTTFAWIDTIFKVA